MRQADEAKTMTKPTPSQFIYKQVFDGLMKKGVNQAKAHDKASRALDMYNKSLMGGLSVAEFIQKKIREGAR